MMTHNGGGDIPASPTGDAAAQAELGVVAIGEKIFVESANLVQHCTPVHGGASIRPKGFFHFVVLAGVELAGAAPSILSVEIDQVGGFVDAARIFVDQDFRRGHSGIGVVFECTEQRGEPAGFRFGIVIKKSDEFASRLGESLIVGGAKAVVG